MSITAGNVRKLVPEQEDTGDGEEGGEQAHETPSRFPICCFLNDAVSDLMTLEDLADDETIPLNDLRWRSFGTEKVALLEEVLCLTTGYASLLVVLDDGADFIGYQMDDGILNKCAVDIRLVPSGG